MATINPFKHSVIDAPGDDGQAPLDPAIENRHCDVAESLRRRGGED